MSFHNTAPCFLTFYHSDQSLLSFKFKIFVLNTSMINIAHETHIRLLWVHAYALL